MFLKALKPHIAASGVRHRVGDVYEEGDAAAKLKIESGLCAAATGEEIKDDTPKGSPPASGGERHFVGLTNAVAVPVDRLDALEAAASELEASKARIAELEGRAGEADDETPRASVEAARVEADKIIAAAKDAAGKITDEAKAKAAKIVSDAEATAQKTLNAELDALKGSGGGGAGAGKKR